MIEKPMLAPDFDQPLIWIYDPRFPAATAAELAKDPLADFDRPMAVIDENELAALRECGYKVEML